MKKLYFLFLLLACSCASAAQLPPVSSIDVEGQVFLTGNPAYITLFGRVAGVNSFSTMRTLNGTSGYVVPGGKTLVLQALKCVSNGPADNLVWGYGDTDVGLAVGGIAPTNFVSESGEFFFPSSTINQFPGLAVGLGFSVPSGKLPTISTAGSGIFSCYSHGILK